MGQLQNNENEEYESIFVDKFEFVENECKRLRRVLPDDVVVMIVKKADLNFFLEGLQASPFWLVLEDLEDEQ